MPFHVAEFPQERLWGGQAPVVHRFEGLCKNPQDGLKTLVEVSLHPLPSDGERNGYASYQSNRAGGGSAPGPRLRPLARPRARVL